MITKNNLLSEYPRIFQSALPEALQQEEFDFIAENFDLYDDDEDIRKYVDTFVEKLNEALEKKPTKAAPKQPKEKTEKTVIKQKSPKPALTKEGSKKPKREPKPKPPKPKKEPKPPKPPKPRKQKAGTEVTEFPIEVTFIKSYCGWAGKVKTKTQVYTFIKRLQKAIAERKIRKTSYYAPQIEYMQKT